MCALLVTGGAGFIGANLVRRCRVRFPDVPVVVLDALTYAGHAVSLDGTGAALVRADVADPAAVADALARHAIDRVIHLAAETHVDRSLHDPAIFARTNVVGTAVLLEAARRAGVSRFVHVSTDEVYGDLGPADPAFTEASPLAPRSPYAASKAGGELMARAHAETFGLPVTIVRPSNAYGPYQLPEKLIPLMIARARAGQPLPVYGDGSNRREWVFVEDLCDGILAALAHGRPGAAYNLGGGHERANLDVVQAIVDAVGAPRTLVQFVTDRPGHDRRYALDSRRAADELGWRPVVDFADGLARTLTWYAASGAWLDAIATDEHARFQRANYEQR